MFVFFLCNSFYYKLYNSVQNYKCSHIKHFHSSFNLSWCSCLSFSYFPAVSPIPTPSYFLPLSCSHSYSFILRLSPFFPAISSPAYKYLHLKKQKHNSVKTSHCGRSAVGVLAAVKVMLVAKKNNNKLAVRTRQSRKNRNKKNNNIKRRPLFLYAKQQQQQQQAATIKRN